MNWTIRENWTAPNRYTETLGYKEGYNEAYQTVTNQFNMFIWLLFITVIILYIVNITKISKKIPEKYRHYINVGVLTIQMTVTLYLVLAQYFNVLI